MMASTLLLLSLSARAAEAMRGGAGLVCWAGRAMAKAGTAVVMLLGVSMLSALFSRALVVVSSGVLLQAGTAHAAEPEYFPLQVGNWWTYEYVNPEGIMLAKAIPGQVDQETKPDRTMRVTGTMVIGSVVESRWYKSSEFPTFEDGDVYHVLTGSMIGAAIGFPPEGRSMQHAALIRRDASRNHILLRGIFNGERWLITREDRILFDFSLDTLAWEVLMEGLKGCAWIMIWAGDRGRLMVPAGAFDCIVFLVDSFCVEFGGGFKWFAEGVGLISEGTRNPDPERLRHIVGWDLKEAFVNGAKYPVSSLPVQEMSWGEVKRGAQ